MASSNRPGSSSRPFTGERLLGTKTPVDPHAISVTDLSVALIREFLFAKGHRKTLEVFGEEEALARKDTRLSSRSEIVKLLGITKLIQVNRESQSPLESFLEVIAQYLSSKTVKDKEAIEVVQKTLQDKLLFGNGMDATLPAARAQSPKSRPLTSRSPQRDPVLQRDIDPRLYVETGPKPTILGAFDAFNPKSVPPLIAPKELVKKPETMRPQSPGGLIIQDLEQESYMDRELGMDSDEDLSVVHQQRIASWAQSKGTPLLTHTIKEVLEIIFPPRTKTNFGEEWTGKGFVFRNLDALRYGLVQVKGGPCGLLAAVQAHVLKNLLFSQKLYKMTDSITRLRPTSAESRTALVSALTDILHQASAKSKKMILVVKSQGGHPSAPFAGLEIHEFTDAAILKDFLEATISQFMMNGPSYNGIIQFLLSLVLTRGMHYIRQDMDEPEGRLMGRHGYCTQEMVNLVLVGAAISNVHDHDLYLGGEPGHEKVLKGIKSRSQFGQLSLFEHYQNLKVGDFFKNPANIPENGTALELFYYDGLANQDDEIRLTLSPSTKPHKKHHDLIPPLEHCIHTKWSSYKVDWNGTEPLL